MVFVTVVMACWVKAQSAIYGCSWRYDVSGVDGTPESVEQLLLEAHENRRLHGRVERGWRLKWRKTGVVPEGKEGRSGVETLGILRVEG